MTREDAITNLEMIRIAYIEPVTELQRKIIDDTFEIAIKALEQINKIADIVDGTIDHFEYDDAMDMLYEIKEVIK